MEETKRRREIQKEYNEKNNITPTTIKKAVRDLISISKTVEKIGSQLEKDLESMNAKEMNQLIKEVTKKMHQAAAELNFEEAAVLRDELVKIKKQLESLS